MSYLLRFPSCVKRLAEVENAALRPWVALVFSCAIRIALSNGVVAAGLIEGLVVILVPSDGAGANVDVEKLYMHVSFPSKDRR